MSTSSFKVGDKVTCEQTGDKGTVIHHSPAWKTIKVEWDDGKDSSIFHHNTVLVRKQEG